MQTPAKITKVALRGFDKADQASARARLEAEGFEVVFSTRSADCVVCAPSTPESVLQQLRGQGARLSALDEFFARHVAQREPRAPALVGEAVPAFVVGDDWVQVLDVRLPRRAEGRSVAGVPPASLLRKLCYDPALLIAARHVALSAARGIPCALEGETAASKTTAVHLVAHWTRQPVIRLNLNGQTDTSELVGRFVPAAQAPAIDMDDLCACAALLPKPLQAMVDGGAPLSPLAQAAVAQALGLKAPTWRFVEGPIPRAMRDGAWVILDEMNLAEPQVLERLNSALEDPPSLTLSEGDGARFGAGGDCAVHEGFRLFATLNPAEYAGRSTLSPAFRDRWRLWHHVPSPQQADLLGMLRALVFGEQPKVMFQGRLYQAPATAPAHPALREVPHIDQVLERVALFHWSVATAAGEGGQAARLGRTRRERSLFSRRLLLTLMDLWDAALRDDATWVARAQDPMRALNHLIQTLYVERIPDQADRDAVAAALQAADLRA